MPPARGRLLPGAEQRIAADLGGGKPLWNRLDRTRPVAARDIANKKAAQIGAAFLLCLKGGYRVASRAVSFASPTASWAAPLALSILPSACIFLSPVSLPAVSLTA